LAMVLADQVAGGVRNLAHLALRHQVAAPAVDDLAVLLRDHLAGRVGHLLHDRVGYLLADGVVDDVTVLLGDVVHAADLADLLARHPVATAHALTGALHLVGDHRTWAVVRGAGARVEDAGAGQPAALSRDRSRDVDLLIGPVAGADGHAPLGHDRHTGV